MLLPKLPPVNLQNTLLTILVLYMTLFLIKELTSQQIKYDNGSMLMTSLVLPCSPPNGGSCFNRMVEWPFEDSVLSLPWWQYPTPGS